MNGGVRVIITALCRTGVHGWIGTRNAQPRRDTLWSGSDQLVPLQRADYLAVGLWCGAWWFVQARKAAKPARHWTMLVAAEVELFVMDVLAVELILVVLVGMTAM